jgi:Fic-DOC domain mobile mystery protein B
MVDAEPDGTRPVDPDETEELLPTHIHTRGELNLWEQENILEAAKWTLRTHSPALSEPTIRELHRRMFDRTWEWAGRYRLSDKTIGACWAAIPVEVHKLVEDGAFWIDNETFEIDEAAVRLHHRLVEAHPFPNGNGRHARLWCDMILRQRGRPPIEWRNEKLDRPGEARHMYIQALRAADTGNIQPLLDLLLQARIK